MRDPAGRHSFYDLDESWYRYMAADKKTRKRMCEEMVEAENLVLGVAAVVIIVFGIIALFKGWI